MLKSCKLDNLCVNVYFNYTPDLTGTHQSLDHINKRKLYGFKNGMYNKHHSQETKERISNKLKGRIISEEAKLKIGNYHRNKKYNSNIRKKISDSHSKLYYIKDIITNEEWVITLNDFIKLKADENLKRNTLNTAARRNYICNKRYLITYYNADITRNSNIKLDNHGETQLDNPVES